MLKRILHLLSYIQNWSNKCQRGSLSLLLNIRGWGIEQWRIRIAVLNNEILESTGPKVVNRWNNYTLASIEPWSIDYQLTTIDLSMDLRLLI